jgi:hypothetical protein
MMYPDDDTPEDQGRAKIASQIEKTAKQLHLTGQRRETFTDSVSLCNTCKWASSRRRKSANIKRIECSIFSGPCPEDISECSEYSTITSLTLGQMADIATIIDISPPKRVGFHGGK